MRHHGAEFDEWNGAPAADHGGSVTSINRSIEEVLHERELAVDLVGADALAPEDGAQHRREFSALRLPDRHADGLADSSPPIFSDLRDSTKNITPTAIIVIESSIGSVRNPSAITGESASRNCSVE